MLEKWLSDITGSNGCIGWWFLNWMYQLMNDDNVVSLLLLLYFGNLNCDDFIDGVVKAGV